MICQFVSLSKFYIHPKNALKSYGRLIFSCYGGGGSVVCNETFRLTHDEGVELRDNDTRVVGDEDFINTEFSLRLPEGAS